MIDCMSLTDGCENLEQTSSPFALEQTSSPFAKDRKLMFFL